MTENNISEDEGCKNLNISKITRKNYKILFKIDEPDIMNNGLLLKNHQKLFRKKIIAKRLREKDNGTGKEGSLERELTKNANNFFKNLEGL